MDARRPSRRPRRAGNQGGAGLGQWLGRLRHHHAVRRLQAIRLRPRPPPARPSQICRPPTGIDHDTLTRFSMNMIFKKFPAAALIDGEWVTSAKTFPVNDPATGDEGATDPDRGG